MQSIKLSIFDKRKLATAYMHLYEALVSQYQSKNMSCGESWDSALRKIKEILVKHDADDVKPAMEYLMEFHKTHNKTQLTKVLQNEHINIKDKKSASTSVKKALDEFEKTIATIAHPNILVNLKNPVNTVSYIDTFYNWANTLPDEQVALLDTDPAEFARQYRKFILSKRVKER